MKPNHGTASAFEAFDAANIGKVFAHDEHGFFFTNNAGGDMASGYALHAARHAGCKDGMNGANVVPVFLKVENPYTFAHYAESFGYRDGSSESIALILDGQGLIGWYDRHKRSIVQAAMADGHDGILLHDPDTDIGGGVHENLVVAFRADQISSIFASEFS